VKQGRYRRVEERRWHIVARQDLTDAWHAPALTILSLTDPHGALIRTAERDRLLIGV
jgi:hypothetical protein